LTGKLPFSREETMDVLFAHATETPPCFADVGAGDWVAPEIENVVMCCLAKNAIDRPSSARELAEKFNEAIFQSQQPSSGAQSAAIDAPSSWQLKPEPAKTDVIPHHVTIPFDPNVIVHQLEAWMPDTIASYKLRGFVQDINGEVLESVPGMIRVRIGGKQTTNWLGLRRKNHIVDLELRLERANPQQQSILHIVVMMSSPERAALNPSWRERCGEVFCELRSYLAGVSVAN
jgi:eukaryotic-like serine/threonine-protein kinase